jgi:hypothetical protein
MRFRWAVFLLTHFPAMLGDPAQPCSRDLSCAPCLPPDCTQWCPRFRDPAMHPRFVEFVAQCASAVDVSRMLVCIPLNMFCEAAFDATALETVVLTVRTAELSNASEARELGISLGDAGVMLSGKGEGQIGEPTHVGPTRRFVALKAELYAVVVEILQASTLEPSRVSALALARAHLARAEAIVRLKLMVTPMRPARPA